MIATERLRLGWVALLFAVAALAAYSPALRGEFLWDDAVFVAENMNLRTPAGLLRIWFEPGANPHYYPVLLTAFWVQFQAWGMNPAGYHAVSLALHVLNALLLYVLLRRLGIAGSLFGGLLFLLHPVHVESVAWIAETKNTLSTAFYLSSLLCALQWCGIGGAPAPDATAEAPARRRRALAFSFALYLAALGSKSTAATLPVSLLLVCWWKRDVPWRRAWGAAIPMLLAGGAVGAFSMAIEAGFSPSDAMAAFTLRERIVAAGWSFWFYLGKLLCPVSLGLIYPRWAPDPGSLVALAAPASAIALLAVLLAASRSIGRGPFAAVFHFAALAGPIPFLNISFVYLHSFVADHFVYVPSLGLAALAAHGWARAPRVPDRLRIALAVALLLALGVLAFRQARTWADGVRLYTHALRVNPSNPSLHNNLGNALQQRGEFARAEAHHREALRLKPDHPKVRNNLAVALLAQGRSDEAILALDEALRRNPGDVFAALNRAHALARDATSAEADRLFASLLDRWPHEPAVLNEYAWHLATQPGATPDALDLAVRLAREACAHTANGDAAYLDTLAAAYAATGSFTQAVATAAAALRLAERAGNDGLAKEIRLHLDLFRREEPYRRHGGAVP